MSLVLPAGFGPGESPGQASSPPIAPVDPFYNPICDPSSEFYDPSLCNEQGPGPVVQPVTQTSTGSTAIATAVASVNVVNNIGDQLAAQIQQAIEDSANNAAKIQQQTAQTISDSISKSVGGVLNGVTSAFGQLGTWFTQIINYIGSHIGDIFSTIANNIGDAVSKIASAVAGAIGPIATAVSGALNDIHDFTANVLAPILNGVNTAIQTISALTTAIERDLHNGLQGILNIPNDIANGLGSLNSAVDRVWQQINEGNRLNTDVTLRDVIQRELGQHIIDMGANITKVGGVSNLATTFENKVNLSEPDISQVTAQFTALIEKVFWSTATQLGKTQDDITNTVLTGKANASWIVQSLIDGGLSIFFTLVAMVGETVPLAEFLSAYTKRQLPLEKLDVGTVIAAWRRGFIDESQVADELGYSGFDATRVKVFKDLADTLISVSDILDMYFKGIVQESDVRANLYQQGFTDVDQTALLANAFKAFGLDTAIRAWRYQDLTDDQFAAILKQNRFSDPEIQTFMANVLDQETVDGVILRHRYGALLGTGLLIDPNFSNLPQDVIDAAHRAGLDKDNAANAWAQSFTVPGLAHWLNLFYRGIRTPLELGAVMDYYKIPKEWQNDYIDGGRPLIPFRTIPTMLKAGIISQTRAAQLLSQHGFDLQSVNDLLNYASRNTTANTATQAAKIHTESVGVASELYALGAITDVQYSAVLQAHGYDPTAIAAQLQLETLKAQVAHRKQVAEDIVGNALEGNISYDTAQSQLAQQGFSSGEQVKYLRQIKSTKATNSKLPSTAELVTMKKNGVIDDDTFKNTLQKAGYSSDWAQKIWAIHFAVFPEVSAQPAS